MAKAMKKSKGPNESLWTGFGVIFACFFLSGATGLIYQVLWLRLLGLIFGHTVYAITTVLAAFMGGLALGSFLFARRTARINNLIRTYGWIEIGIGGYCALLPFLLLLASHLYLGLHSALAFSYNAFSFVQFLLIFSLLLVPTTLMGGTLPVLSQALVKHETGMGQKVGALYAVNTFGAVIGVILAGYLLLPLLGNRATIAIAAVANVAVGVLAITYSRSWRASEAEAVQPEQGRAAPVAPATSLNRGSSDLGAWLTVAALGVSGAVSMIYEIAWTRALALVIGSSTYAFTSMLVAFLVGIAGGSALYSWLWGLRRASPAAFALIQVGIGLAVTLTLLLFERMPELFLIALRWSDSPMFVQLAQFAVSAGSLLPSTLLIGATFPCAVAVAVRRARRVGQDVGQIYAVNTLGAIAGTVIGGFLLIAAIGVHGSIKVGIALNLLLGAALFATLPRRASAWRWGGIGAALIAAIGLLFIPPWDQRVMSSGPAIYGKWYLEATQRTSLADILRTQQLLFYRDGLSGTVSVNQQGQHVFLRVNGKMDAGTAVDMPTQLMSGHLPLLLHPAPRAVLVIGLGSGITAGAVTRHPIERLDIAEIEPAVVEASRFFVREHRDVLKDPRVRTVIADGRNFLLTTPDSYDVIISEPSNPWIGGLASLFSVEFFQLARQRLRPGGIMLQWLQGYNIFPEDLRMIVKTFRTVFPSTSIWNTIRGDFLFVGKAEPMPLDPHIVKARYHTNPGVWGDLERFGVSGWSGVLGYFMLGEADTARFSEGAGLNTDDRLPLEFSAPRALYMDTTDRNWQLMRSFKNAEFPDLTPNSRSELEQPEVRYWIGVGYLSRDALEDALIHFNRALQLDPEHTPSILGANAVYLRLGRPSMAMDLAQKLLAREPLNATALFQAGLASEALNKAAQAVTYLEQAIALQPQNSEFQTALRRARVRGGVQ